MADNLTSVLYDLEPTIVKTAGLAQSLYFLMEPAGPMGAEERAAIMWVVSEVRSSAAEVSDALTHHMEAARGSRVAGDQQTSAAAKAPIVARLGSETDLAKENERLQFPPRKPDTARNSDLTSVQTDVLANLYDGLRVIDDVITAVMSQPRSSGFPEHILDDWSTQICLDMDAIIRELRTRSHTERSAEMILNHELACPASVVQPVC